MIGSARKLRSSPGGDPFHDFLHQLNAVVWELSSDLNSCSFVNQKAESLLGYPLAQWFDEPLFILRKMANADAQAFLANIRALDNPQFQQARASAMEARVMAAGGRPLWFRIESYYFSGQYVCMMVDISHEKDKIETIEHQFTQIMETVPIGIVISDAPSGRVRFFNSAVAKIFGFKPIDVENSPMMKALLESPSLGGEIEFVCPNGNKRAIYSSSSAIQDRLGKIVGCVNTFCDITQQKKTEMDLARSLSLLKATIDSTADGILVVDAKGDMASFNQKFAEMWRIPQSIIAEKDDEKALAFVINQLVEPSTFLDKVKDLYLHPDIESYDTLEFKDGRIFERYSRPQLLESQIVGRVWSFRDVTQRIRAETRVLLLSEAGAVLSSFMDHGQLLENLAEVVIPRFADHLIVHSNDGKMSFSSVDPSISSLLQPIIEDVEVSSQPRRWTHFDQKKTPCGVQLKQHGIYCFVSVPLVSRNGTLGSMSFLSTRKTRLYTSEDLSVIEELGRRLALTIENYRLYQEAQKAIRVREDTLAIVSHDLKNPICSILLGIELLRKAEPSAEQLDRVLVSMRRSAEAANTLIRDLLDIARIEAGGILLNYGVVRLEDLLEEVYALVQPIAAEKNIQILKDLPKHLEPLYCDRPRIVQVLSNLLGNAIKFSPAGKPVIIRIFDRPTEFILEVQDEGPGIAPEQLHNLFKRYWQAPHTQQKGTGLGLFITKGIIEAHHGRVWVESTLGKGSQFFCTLPKKLI